MLLLLLRKVVIKSLLSTNDDSLRLVELDIKNIELVTINIPTIIDIFFIDLNYANSFLILLRNFD